MAFKKVVGGTLGLIFGVTTAIVSIVPGCQEAWKPNNPGETDGEQFIRGASRGVVNAFQAGFEGATSAITPKNVERVLENADKARTNIQQGVDQYNRSRAGGSSSAPGGAVEPGVVLPPYQPRPIPGDAPPEPGK